MILDRDFRDNNTGNVLVIFVILLRDFGLAFCHSLDSISRAPGTTSGSCLGSCLGSILD